MHYSIVFNNNKVQNGGFTILSKQGVTISHVTLNNTLNKVKSDIDKKKKNRYTGNWVLRKTADVSLAVKASLIMSTQEIQTFAMLLKLKKEWPLKGF